MKPKKPVIYLIENSVILLLVAYKKNKEILKQAFDLLTQEKWYKDFNIASDQLSKQIKDKVVAFQKREYDDLHTLFITNTHLIQRDVSTEHYQLYTELLQEIVMLHEDDRGENALLTYHKTVFSFMHEIDESPMFTLSYQRFYEYIESLILYASVDNKDFNLHQNESMLILNEIKAYIRNKPMHDVKASELFFPILEVARKKSKNHISTRFEGIVKSNLRAMDDAQDAYFLAKLQELSRVDAVHSVQEKLFDSIITASIAKVAPYEKKQREGTILLQEINLISLPFSANEQLIHNVIARLPTTAEEAIMLLWRWIQSAMVSYFSEEGLVDITKKTLFILNNDGKLQDNQHDYILRLRSLSTFVQFINWESAPFASVAQKMATVYVYYKQKPTK